MISNIKDYVKVYNNVLSHDFCKTVVNNLSNCNWQEHTFHCPKLNEFTKNKNELSVSYDNIQEKIIIEEKIWHTLKKYVSEDFAEFSSWWGGWNGYSSVRFNRYDTSTEMKLHCDHIHTLFDGTRKGIPTLSIVGLLNNDYEGGEFIMWEEETINLTTGSIMIFPSNFMFPHCVTTVTKGIRHSFVSWAW